MKERTTYIDESLLVCPSHCDEKVRVFQRKLYSRAKQEKGFRAYSLYDKICLDYVLIESWRRVKQSYAVGTGVDAQSFSDIEKQGLHLFLTTLQRELKEKTYRCQAVRRVFIPKDDKGNYRPLGIPTIRDRVVQMAVKMVIEPLWEADFTSTSYGFRPKKSAHDAIRQIKQNIYEGYQYVYDADLAKYFDTIPHQKLFILLKERLADAGILNLIGQWLTAPVAHENGMLEQTREGTPRAG
jgi:RNA-directed DNA polymerase